MATHCDRCGNGLFFHESVRRGRCYSCHCLAVAAAPLVMALAERVYACHEILAHKAERRPVVLTEKTYCPLTGDAA